MRRARGESNTSRSSGWPANADKHPRLERERERAQVAHQLGRRSLDRAPRVEQSRGRAGAVRLAEATDLVPHLLLAPVAAGTDPHRRPPALPVGVRPTAGFHAPDVEDDTVVGRYHDGAGGHPVLLATLEQLALQQQDGPRPALVATSSPTTWEPARSATVSWFVLRP